MPLSHASYEASCSKCIFYVSGFNRAATARIAKNHICSAYELKPRDRVITIKKLAQAPTGPAGKGRT